MNTTSCGLQCYIVHKRNVNGQGEMESQLVPDLIQSTRQQKRNTINLWCMREPEWTYPRQAFWSLAFGATSILPLLESRHWTQKGSSSTWHCANRAIFKRPSGLDFARNLAPEFRELLAYQMLVIWNYMFTKMGSRYWFNSGLMTWVFQ